MEMESAKVEQIVSQFRSKILHVILDSRVPSFHNHSHQQQQQEPLSLSRVRKTDRWFNLVLGDRPAALENLNFSLRNLLDPMIIDIILVQHGSCSSSVDNLYSPSAAAGGPSTETVIERWVVQYDCPRVFATPSGTDASCSYKKTYKKSIILLRSLYAQMRLLPAYRIFRQLSSLSQTYNFDLIYKVSSFSHPFSREEEAAMKEYCFVPVEAIPGRLCVSVTYRTTLSDFNLEPMVSLPPKIITDYVGSPTTDPMRSFPSSEKGVRATSFPLRGVRPPSPAPAAFQRPHSWSSGFHRGFPFTPNQSVAGSPPANRTSPMPYDIASPPSDMYGNRIQNQRLSTLQQVTAYDEYQLSPPFSPSASPSPPTYLSANPLLTHHRSETAPVSIPLPLTSRSSRYLSPNSSDPSRHSLPPMSPRSSKHDNSSQESPSAIRAYRKMESLRAGESPSGLSPRYSAHKVVRDSKEDSGRFSGLLSSSGSPRIGFSRSSSRLSFQDDMDDCEFSCPFDVDDVDVSDSLASRNVDGKKASEFNAQSASVGKKSQDAAVGILVHMLRTAPPLRQDSSCYSTHSLRNEYEGGVGTASGFFMPRKTADALEELRSYREMKDLLLSKSGRVIRKEDIGCRPIFSAVVPASAFGVPSSELQWHANSHFEDEDEEVKDLKLANQIASSSGSSNADDISSLISLQTRSNFYHVKDGLISLLRNCLELEAQHNSSVTILSGYVDHFQSLRSEDVGWGCGWRNIQMLSSHLLAHRQEAREVLFGGAGFVPDIVCLQRWLEIAWERGFDPPGAQQFNCKVYGSNHWIGTTECASLFCSFGLRARVVDFGPKESQTFYLSVPGSALGQEVVKRKAIKVSGPMDRYVHQKQGSKKSRPSCDSSGGRISDNSKGKSEGPQVLVDWVWNYFADEGLNMSGSSRVVVSDRA
ncbi:Peptidase C78, ubiquitin modifier-specific peptidase 1/ 2 [Corchorus olitorius]|uniref:Peptidase C78, ubiquitin modifier-specific peptidase 1/ 2 n=1 Tax=Corchorus olitorius TaxID=93759 RepID=A0A1R3JSD1_9ROSI|nr:Peptidase C78, ubiquitin modifier-specific peptidase 1/ 2 [Corchorus olitorius]